MRVYEETLRDKFAMAALSGFLANEQVTGQYSLSTIAESTYKYADAMIEARFNSASNNNKEVNHETR